MIVDITEFFEYIIPQEAQNILIVCMYLYIYICVCVIIDMKLDE